MQNEAINANSSEVKKYIFLAVLFFLVDFVVYILCFACLIFGLSPGSGIESLKLFFVLYIVGSMLFEFFYIFFMGKSVFLFSKLSGNKKVLIFCLFYLLIVLLCDFIYRIVLFGVLSILIAFSPFGKFAFWLDFDLFDWFGVCHSVLVCFLILSYALFMWSLFKMNRDKFFLYSALFFCLFAPFLAFIAYTPEYYHFFYWNISLKILTLLSFVIAWFSFKQIHLKENYG